MNALERAKAEGRLCLNIEECGPIFGVSRGTIFGMARSGVLPTILVGQRRRVVPLSQLEKLLEGAGQAPGGPQVAV